MIPIFYRAYRDSALGRQDLRHGPSCLLRNDSCHQTLTGFSLTEAHACAGSALDTVHRQCAVCNGIRISCLDTSWHLHMIMSLSSMLFSSRLCSLQTLHAANFVRKLFRNRNAHHCCSSVCLDLPHGSNGGVTYHLTGTADCLHRIAHLRQGRYSKGNSMTASVSL